MTHVAYALLENWREEALSVFGDESEVDRAARPDEPAGWLTTRVNKNPRSVVLLDEVEKADWQIWNTFLQVFDAGRLTDGRGVTADFSETIIIMTTNLGAREAAKGLVGFGDQGQHASVGKDRQLGVIKNGMAPELVNRIDEIILFNPLTLEVIEEIAVAELAKVTTRLEAAGWSIEYAPEVTEWLAATGYDPVYGARHLHRNIERELLLLLAEEPGRELVISVGVDGLELRAKESKAVS